MSGEKTITEHRDGRLKTQKALSRSARQILAAVAPELGKAGGRLAGKVLYAGVGRFGHASTGTPIKSTFGIARENAIKARIGGGALSVGGGGIARGELLLEAASQSVSGIIYGTICGILLYREIHKDKG